MCVLLKHWQIKRLSVKRDIKFKIMEKLFILILFGYSAMATGFIGDDFIAVGEFTKTYSYHSPLVII